MVDFFKNEKNQHFVFIPFPQVYDLLDQSWGHMGAFVPRTYPKGYFNHELEEYTPEACQYNSGQITITAKKQGSKVTSGRLDTNGVWSTSKSEAIKNRGYVEVRATMPTRPNGTAKYEGLSDFIIQP